MGCRDGVFEFQSALHELVGLADVQADFLVVYMQRYVVQSQWSCCQDGLDYLLRHGPTGVECWYFLWLFRLILKLGGLRSVFERLTAHSLIDVLVERATLQLHHIEQVHFCRVLRL